MTEETKAPTKTTKRPPAPKRAAERDKATVTATGNEGELLTPLDKLKAQAELLDISYREDVTENALRKIIMDALAQADTGETVTDKERRDSQKEANKLMRCIITPNSPQHKDYQGQLFTVGNSVVGFLTKFVQFNVEYHVPKIIYDHIQRQQLQYFVNKKDGRNIVRESRMRKAYTITDLDPLTQEELDELKANQLARQGMDA